MSARPHSQAELIAWTFASDVADVRDARYQRYANPAVYVVGNDYYAVSKAKPTHDVGHPWEAAKDQFAAARVGKTLWVSRARSPK